MYKNSWYDAYLTFSVWYNVYGLTIEGVRERFIAIYKVDNCSFDFIAEMQYWCVLFYGQPIFEPYPEDQPSLLW